MGTKYCSSCGTEIDDEAIFCSKCGSKQPSNYNSSYDYQQANNDNKSQSNHGMSTNKILSFIALGLSIVSIVLGGLFAEIAAIIISIIILNSQGYCEPEARTIAKIALIISVILAVIRIVLVFIVGGMVFSMYGDIFRSIGNMYY